MLIKCGEEWKNFERIICKLSPILEVQCDNCIIKCTLDHVFKGIKKRYGELLLVDTIRSLESLAIALVLFGLPFLVLS